MEHAPNETTDGVLQDLLPDLHQAVAELLDSLRANWVASDGLKQNVSEVRRVWGPVTVIKSFILREPAYLCLRAWK